MSINIDYFALKKDVKVPSSFVIAPADAVNKERADLVLTGDPEADRAAIQEAIDDLHNKRESTGIAIRIDFLGGTIDVGTKTDGNVIVIPLGYDNIHLYGNGVKIAGYVEMYSVFTNNADNVIIDGFNVNNSSNYGDGLSNSGTNCTIIGNTCSSSNGNGLYNSGTNCTIIGNTCSSINYGLYNTGTNCTITGNTCSSINYGLSNTGTNCIITGNTCSGKYGLYNTGTNCTIIGNTCSSEYDYGLYNGSTSTTDKCIITGNICLNGGISVKSGTCLPATQSAMADVNTGTITIRP